MYDSDGVGPAAGLVQGSDGNFYGITSGGLWLGYDDPGIPKIRGIVFGITPRGTFTTLASFNGCIGQAKAERGQIL